MSSSLKHQRKPSFRKSWRKTAVTVSCVRISANVAASWVHPTLSSESSVVDQWHGHPLHSSSNYVISTTDDSGAFSQTSSSAEYPGSAPPPYVLSAGWKPTHHLSVKMLTIAALLSAPSLMLVVQQRLCHLYLNWSDDEFECGEDLVDTNLVFLCLNVASELSMIQTLIEQGCSMYLLARSGQLRTSRQRQYVR